MFAGSREGRRIWREDGTKAGPQKLLQGKEQGDESPLKSVIQFKMVHFENGIIGHLTREKYKNTIKKRSQLKHLQ